MFVHGTMSHVKFRRKKITEMQTYIDYISGMPNTTFFLITTMKYRFWQLWLVGLVQYF